MNARAVCSLLCLSSGLHFLVVRRQVYLLEPSMYYLDMAQQQVQQFPATKVWIRYCLHRLRKLSFIRAFSPLPNLLELN